MWRKVMVTGILSLCFCGMNAQSSEEMEAILRLTGCDAPENLDEYEVERLYHWLEHPVRINTMSVSDLRSCGLFSAYQAASLYDYRSRHGDVMSLSELSSIDGYNKDTVEALAPFISLQGGDVGLHGSMFSHDLAVKGGASLKEGSAGGNYGLKYKFEMSDRISVAVSASRSASAASVVPDMYSGHLSWKMKVLPVRLMAGDFNARFGQGLALWNGFSMSGLGKTSSFLKSSSGLSSSWSFTGSSAFTGVTGEVSVSRMRLSVLVAFPGIRTKGLSGATVLPAVNLGWYGRAMTMSLTHYLEFVPASGGISAYIPDMKTSFDVAMCLRGVDIFSEVAFDWVNMTPAALAGVVFPYGEELRMAAHLRYYPSGFNPSRSAAIRSGSRCSNEYSVSLSSDYTQGSGKHAGSISVDASYRPEPKAGTELNLQVKTLADYTLAVNDCLKVKFRLSERFRTWDKPYRTDMRADVSWTGSRFVFASRFNVLHCVGTGLLGYVEGGYKTGRLSSYLRLGLYRIDNWDDRIYVYERDAPGNFTVPAFYGRGAWASLTASWRYSGWGRLYVRTTIKPGKAELKLQSVFSF